MATHDLGSRLTMSTLVKIYALNPLHGEASTFMFRARFISKHTVPLSCLKYFNILKYFIIRVIETILLRVKALLMTIINPFQR